jgi:hypothetical protein
MCRHGDPGWHHCMDCNYNNRFNTSDPTETIQDEVWVRTFNDREYHLFIDYAKDECRLYEYFTSVNPARNLCTKDLLVVDHMITINPQTIDNKIKTYLLFL